jgi:CBS-domain-containing membrane protein
MNRKIHSPWLRAIFQFLGIERDTVGLAEKLISGVGGLVGIYLILLVTRQFLGATDTPLIVASMGASAVLLFAAPHGAFSQPWNLVGGHAFSAAIGVGCAYMIPDTFAAAATSVGTAIAAMYILRCIHPPGGATALMAVIGGPDVHSLGFDYVVTPVLLNVAVIFVTAIVFNYPLPWRRYPPMLAADNRTESETGPVSEAGEETGLEADDFEYALNQIGSFIDVTEHDLEAIYRLALRHALENHLSPDRIRIGEHYSNGAIGPRWSVRRVLDGANDTTDERSVVIYRIVAGDGAYRTGKSTRGDFARWAQYPVKFVDGSWMRTDDVP